MNKAAANCSDRTEVKTVRHGLGLVLSGGGMQGAYEIGVWHALEQIGAAGSIGGIFGTSVGALNALLLETAGYRKAHDIWLDLKPSDFCGWPESALIPETAAAILEKHTASRQIRREICVFCQSAAPPNPVHMFRLRDCGSDAERSQILLASAAMPEQPPVQIGGQFFRGGGIGNANANTPVIPMRAAGWRRILSVWLDYDAVFPRVPDCKVLHIRPSDRRIGRGFTGLPKTDRKLLHDIMAMGFNDTMLQKPLILRLAAECEAGKEST